jgi:hypothetical protein
MEKTQIFKTVYLTTIFFIFSLLLSNARALAQSDCGRFIMQNKQSPNAIDVKNACQNSIIENKSIQLQAQARIEARIRWNSIEPNLKNCLDDAFKLEGSSIELKIRDGILPSSENTTGYLNARNIKC